MPSTPLPRFEQYAGRPGSPYNSPFSWRTFGSDVGRAVVLPAPVDLADRFTGNNLQYGADRLFGGVRDRYLQNEANYMQDLMRSDPGYGSGGGLGGWLRRLFGGGEQSDNLNNNNRSPTSRPPLPGGNSNNTRQPLTDAERRNIEREIISNRNHDIINQEYNRVRQPIDGRRGRSAGSSVIAQRTGDPVNDAALERAAEGFLGSSPVARQQSLGQQARSAMDQMFRNSIQ